MYNIHYKSSSFPPSKDMITIILIVWSSARDLSFQSDVDAIEANADQFINCTTLINKNQEVLVLSCILVIILMISLLRYISDLIPFLYEFVQMIATVRKTVYWSNLINYKSMINSN